MLRAGISIWMVLALVAPLVGFAAQPVSNSSVLAADSMQTIRAVLATPEDQIDLAATKLRLDKIIDPAIDIAASLRQIDQMAQKIKAMAGPAASNRRKLKAVRDYLFISGDWNGHHPFQYDLDDPLGYKLTNKLLPNYMASKRGNCITMPYLFIVLADRIGLKISAATVPLHVYVKYTDDVTGETVNIEATNGGGLTRDIWYRQKAPMTDTALANGIYMKALTKRETLAVMADVILEFNIMQGRYEQVITAADLILAAYPKDVYAMVKQGTAYGHLMDERFVRKYPNPGDIPPALRAEYVRLAEGNRLAFERAEALGWRASE